MQSPDKTKLLATALSLNLISPRPSVLPMLELTVKYAAVLYSPSPRDGKQPLVGLTPQKAALERADLINSDACKVPTNSSIRSEC
jgi:hypothetical protein